VASVEAPARMVASENRRVKGDGGCVGGSRAHADFPESRADDDVERVTYHVSLLAWATSGV